ncbi:MAG: HD domain-containing protein [Desulfurococcales archaeon]|nr:HD domain-containing protein [Desulfurococcales archaeon]
MAHVSPSLVKKYIEKNSLLRKAWEILVNDVEIQELLKMSNVNAVSRLLYNDHGPVHAAIVSGSALEIYEILKSAGIKPSSLEQRVVPSEDYSRLIVLLGAYLHDIGNSVHRENHELIGALLSNILLDRILREIVDSKQLIYRIKSEVMGAIYSTAMNVKALTIEASIVKVADATDMAEGRARLPYSRGKEDIHALSALSITRVELKKGRERPLIIEVYMKDLAGMFQIEKVLLPKLNYSLIREYTEIRPILMNGSGQSLKPIKP